MNAEIAAQVKQAVDKMKQEFDSKLKAEMVNLMKDSMSKKQFKVAPPKKNFTSPTRPLTAAKSPSR